MCLFILEAKVVSPEAVVTGYQKIGIRPQCDCNTVLGSRLFEGFSEKQRKELEKKGWSASKIKRAEDDQKKSRLHQSHDLMSAEDELKHWLKTIPEKVQRENWMGLVLHWGDEDMKFELKGRKSIALADLTPELLGNLEREVLYLFTP